MSGLLMPDYCSKFSTRTSKQHDIRKPSNEIERRVYGLMERFTSRAKLFEITQYPENLTRGSNILWDNLSLTIWDVYSAKAQKATTYIKKLELWQNVYLQIKVICLLFCDLCCTIFCYRKSFIVMVFLWWVLQCLDLELRIVTLICVC